MKNSDLYGIVTSQECAEMNEFSKLVGWEAEYHQLGRGKYQASLQFTLGCDIRVTHQSSNRGMSMGGVPPQDHLAVLLPIYTGRNSIIQGQVFGKDDMAVMHPGSQAQFRAPRNFQMITASIKMSRLVPSFQALTKRELDRFVDQTAIVTLPPQI